MNKQEFVEQLAQKANLPKSQAKAVVDVTTQLIVEGTQRGEKVTFTGFGTFEPYERKAVRRFNPRTRSAIQVPAKRVPKFRAGKTFRSALAR